MRLLVRHRTIYRYARPVRFLEHRLLVMPRSDRDVAVVRSELTIDPAAEVAWSLDAIGNVAAAAQFASAAATLSILVEHEVSHTAEPYPVYRIDPAAHRHPFDYAPGDLSLLGPAVLGRGEGRAVFEEWIDRVRASASEDTLTLLKALNDAVGSTVTYQSRTEEGTQAPEETLVRRTGSCRDLAALFLAAARRLGFAARAASGYLYDPGAAAGDAGATHAWCEVLLPGAGWIAFDPTRRHVGTAGLITTAVGVSSEAVLPVVGGFVGDPADFLGMDVELTVSPADPA